MKKNLYYILYIGVLMMFLAGCQDEGMFTGEEETSETPVNVSFRVKLEGEEMSRAIGDASLVNELVVGVFQNSVLLKTHTFIRGEGQEKFTNVTIPLFKNQTYDLAFWAQVKDNGIYSIDENFNISIDYSKYKDISLAGTEVFEAFTIKKTGVTVGTDTDITLTRPFAQLNVAASEAEIFDKVDATRFTISKVYKIYHPFSGAVVEDAVKNQEFSFTFSNDDIDTKQSITIDGKNYYYLASAYLLAPEKVNMIGGLYKDGEEYRSLSFTDLPLAANTRTNIYGDMIQQEIMQGWDGVTFADLSDEGLTCQVQVEGANNVLHIDTPEELAYCMRNGYPSGYDAIHICANHNMGGHVWNSVANVPNEIIIDGKSADGELTHAISNVKLQGKTTGLFGNTEELKVSNLQLKEFEVNTSSDVAGVLAGTVKGNSSFTNVVIDNCNVVANNGKAGGMIGYIGRKSEKERTETLSVSFKCCQVNNSTISANASEGIFVGELSGYDNQETLSFDAECSAENTAITDFVSSYQSVNQSVWANPIEATYDNWLGTETYRRGVVKFGEVQLVPKWDGKTKDIVPLVENNVDMIYSPYDVAYYQKKSPSTVTFKTNVDLGSHNFDPIKSITNLDGENHTIYNLKVDMVHDGTGAAFIQSASGTTTHKDITFVGADIKNVHNPEIPTPAYGVTNDGGAGNAYAGTLVSHSGGTYNVSNVHVKSGKVYAVCKMGGLVGYVGGNLKMTNCSVDDYTIENYEPGIPNYYTLTQDDTKPWIEFKSLAYVNLLQWWYTNGEAGGLIGFIKAENAMIESCAVINTDIKCNGQADKKVTANVYHPNRFNKNDPFKKNVLCLAQGSTTIAGRHVNQFIGDVVSERSSAESTAYTVTIKDYFVSGNSYDGVSAESVNTYNHCYATNTYCEVVGSAYYVGLELPLSSGYMKDYPGTLIFQPRGGEMKTVTETDGNSMSWTGGNFSIDGALVCFSKYPTYP
ncbi:MAG: hypothetical protein IJE78_08400 [Bacteroidaceae bacterium]|nr:hypothetical protein [Bacteroidaceae bacterium]